MKKFTFAKLTGAGNDFVLFDRKNVPDINLNANFIKKVCDRRFGIGGDGVILIEDSDEVNFIMTYFNSDGSEGTLCGNGARCALRYADVSGRVKNSQAVFFNRGVKYSGEILDEEKIKFYLNSPKNLKYNFKIKAAGQMINSSFADTGSPHAVIRIGDVAVDPKRPKIVYDEIEKFPVYDLGKEIRHSPDFNGGANVNFIKIEDQKIYIRTFERGVEDETFACGTGSVASALVSYVNDGLRPPIKLITKGGDELIVDFKVENQRVSDLSLTGPAYIAFTGEFFTNIYT